MATACLLAVAVVGCTVGVPPTGTVPGSIPAGPDPAVSTAMSPPATATPTATPTETPTPSPATTATPAPPQAEIVTADASIAGALGTYTIDGGGSDSPWLPFETLPAISVGVRDTLILRFVDGAAIGDFQAVVAAASDTGGASPRAVDGSRSADGLSITVGPLPAGRWVLEARLFRADGRGDGLTFWAVTVA